MTILSEGPPIPPKDLSEEELRCPECGGTVRAEAGDSLTCLACARVYPILRGVPRMLTATMRLALEGDGAGRVGDKEKAATARSFGYEWSKFSTLHKEYEENFLGYHAPRGPEFFRGKRVLDAGCGSGRHAYHAAMFGAEVWAVDLGPAVDVARFNTRDLGSVQVVQADLYALPFAPESFDYIYSLGVLHHLLDPEAGFRALMRYLKPGGEMCVYLYWRPEGQPIKSALLGLVGLVRRITTRLPYGVVHALSYPAAVLA